MSEMKRTHALADLAFSGDAWHGPSLIATLKGVSAAQAVRKPLPNVHSIWELTLHCAYWKETVIRQLAGETVATVEEENFPTVKDHSEAAWKAAQVRLAESHRSLLEAIARMRVEELETEKDGESGASRNYVRLHGIIHHDLYHAGQIALLKKA